VTPKAFNQSGEIKENAVPSNLIFLLFHQLAGGKTEVHLSQQSALFSFSKRTHGNSLCAIIQRPSASFRSLANVLPT
jgi:hypothetical protein